MKPFSSAFALLFAALITNEANASDTPVTTRADQTLGTPEQVAAGATRYPMCAGCHGMNGEGIVGTAPRLNSELTEEDVSNVVAFVRDWQLTDSVSLNDGPLEGSVEQGAMLYNTGCSTCHGRSGAGYQESGSGTGIGRKGFLDQVSDAELRGFITYGKDKTAMRPFSETSPMAMATNRRPKGASKTRTSAKPLGKRLKSSSLNASPGLSRPRVETLLDCMVQANSRWRA